MLLSISSRRLCQASFIAFINAMNDGLGKYVPPKNGRPSGVIKTVIGHPPRPDIACTASIYSASISGRSSRSTFIFTKSLFIKSAVSLSSKHS
ncbi:unannotated protein [freshwater metagenome]|uniref:Unannotated protein n=1 Tax=freshwater metagenome TaxID=449393 RepID=A0A6J6H5I9_9ZZZZ